MKLHAADIIGAGIGGLTAAIALENKQIETRIFEQASALKPIGAGILLANNAMQVYERLGLRDIIEENGNPISSMNITKSDLKPLSRIDLTYFEKKYKSRNIAIHRGSLQQILMDNIKSSHIRINHRLTSIKKETERYLIGFENGKQYESSAVIGADGIRSIVRQSIFPNNRIRNAYQFCWRGISEYTLPIQFRNELNECWGKTGRFGFVRIAPKKVYWYALKSFHKDHNECSLTPIEEHFTDFHPIIIDIINSTKTDVIHTAEISDLKPTNIWQKDNICLIGDAAHATTPNMGQGACQAIEDAHILSECLARYDTSHAFKKYQVIRRAKAHQVVRTSWSIGKIAHLKHPIWITLRNQMLKWTPPSVNRKLNDRIFQLEKI